MLRYQQQDCTLTLAQGLEEFYAANAGRIPRPQELDPCSRRLFRNHDICHVVFGLDTIMGDEAVSDIRTVTGTDVGWRRYLQYVRADPAARRIVRELGYARVVRLAIVSLPRMLRASWSTRRMPQRWPFEAPDAFLAQPIRALRERYGIRVL